MAGVGEIRQAIADAVADATGIRVYPYVPLKPEPPCAIVWPDRGQFQAFGRGQDEWHFTVQMLVPLNDDRSAQARLDEWISGYGETSVRQALYNATALNIPQKSASCAALEVNEYTVVTAGDGRQFLAANLDVRVLTKGTE